MSPTTERDKMLAGEPYNCLDPALAALREEAKALMRRHGRVESESERQSILKQLLGGIGHDSLIEPPFFCTYGRNIYLGDHVYLNALCHFIDNGEVRIGDHVMMGPGVQIYTAAHSLRIEERNRGLEVAVPVVVEDNVWIGGSAILLPGVTVGRNAVVGAGAVVTRDVPPDAIVGGNPARVIRII